MNTHSELSDFRDAVLSILRDTVLAIVLLIAISGVNVVASYLFRHGGSVVFAAYLEYFTTATSAVVLIVFAIRSVLRVTVSTVRLLREGWKQ
jgi:hypothetical protein